MVHPTPTHFRYVPCLPWKQGEYLALSWLPDATRDHIVPLIEVPEIGYDFEHGRPKKTMDQLLGPFAKRVGQKWDKRPCLVDFRRINPSDRMASGVHPVEYVFGELRGAGLAALPVTGPTRDKEYQRAVGDVCATDQRGICVRVAIAEAVKRGSSAEIVCLLRRLRVQADEAHLVLDLGAPQTFLPLDGFCKLVKNAVCSLPLLDEWRSLVVLGTAFPESIAGVGRPSAVAPRNEWLLYVRLLRELSSAGIRTPTFGDYGISHPRPLPSIDWRKVSRTASIKYATSDSWFFVRGGTIKARGYEQYADLCRLVVDSAHYAGASFSEGDEYIRACASGTGRTGNMTKWVQVGTNHHLARAVQDIASLPSP